jgi:hypothetical protein
MRKWHVYGPSNADGASPLLTTVWATSATDALDQAMLMGLNAQRARLVQ